MRPLHVLVSLLFPLSAVALAQDPRDAEIFGGAPASPGTPAATPGPTSGEPLPPEASQGNLTKISESSLADTLQIGGRLEYRTSTGLEEQQKLSDTIFSQLKQGDVYLDARPNPNLRAFLRFRLSQQDPVLGLGKGPGAGSASISADARCSDCVKAQIDELWFKFDVASSAYVTAGKQHLKWGSGRIWNPTDFTALESRDPFALSDRRLGQTLVKVHVPVEKSGDNFYLVGQFDDVSRTRDVGGAVRGEFTFLGSGELALSAQVRKEQALRLGADVSSALGPVDVRVEIASSTNQRRTFYEGVLDPESGRFPTEHTRKKAWFTQAVGGLEKTWKYSDEDTLTLGGEYFYNQLGYSRRDLEIYALLSGQTSPLYSGEQYVGAYLRAPAPGSWNDVSFFLTGIENLSDETGTARLTGAYTLYKMATVEAFVSRCFGDYGELCFRVPEKYRRLAQSGMVPDAQRGRLLSLPTRRTLMTAGLGISMAF